MFETFHFLRPEWLWAIIPVTLLLFFSIRRVKRSSAWDDVCDAPLLQYQLTQQQNNTSTSTRLFRWLIPFSFLMLVFSITIAALAGPSWEKKEQPVFQQEDALVIILDLSLSMNAEDIKPSRLERAKLKLTDILKQKKEGQTALVAFAGDAHVVSPLTIDNKTIISLLPALDITIMPLSGSHINDALSSAAELLKNSGFMRGDILLMTDGIDEKQQKKVSKKINSLKNQGYNLSIIGIGSRAGSPIPMPGSGGFIKDSAGQVVLSKLNTGPLKELAQLGGGSYHTLSLDDSDFQSLLDKDFSTNNKLTEQDNYQEKEHEQWVDAGAYITLLILPLALLVFRKGLLSISLVFLLGCSFFIHPAEAQAAAEPSVSDAAAFTQFTQNKSWKNLWSTPDQQGQKAFNNKSYSAAAEQFNNARWKAGSYYRAGDFEQAVEQYEQLDDVHSLFNKGNSLAHLQKYEEAIQSYDDALEIDPDLSDAVKNRAAIKEFLEKQKQQSEQEKQKESEQDKDKKQDQNKDQDSQQENSEQDKKDQSEQQDQQNQSENNDSEQDTEQKAEQKSEQNSEQNTEQEQEQEQEQDKKAQNNQSEQPDEAAQEKQKQEADEQAEEKDSQAAEQQEVEKTDAEAGENTADDVLSQLSQEQQQSLKQWLQRIPDNPGELLRIKFRNNSLNKQRQQNIPEQYEGNPW